MYAAYTPKLLQQSRKFSNFFNSHGGKPTNKVKITNSDKAVFKHQVRNLLQSFNKVQHQNRNTQQQTNPSPLAFLSY